MTPLEKSAIVTKVVTVFDQAKGMSPDDKMYILMAVIETLGQPEDSWRVSVMPLDK
ncbi:MAG: hypothetical protein HZB62_15120 [Nitrospirae bacterium]|nr:hypothetical protein [Nitrospirota bacterium]